MNLPPRRPPPPPSAAPDALFLLALIAGPGLAAAAWLAARLPPGLQPACHMHRLTGIPCPTCGMFRCLGLLASGRFADAWRLQPLGTGLIAGALAASAVAWTLLALRRSRAWPNLSRRHMAIALTALAILAALNWLYLLLTGV